MLENAHLLWILEIELPKGGSMKKPKLAPSLARVIRNSQIRQENLTARTKDGELRLTKSDHQKKNSKVKIDKIIVN